MRPGMDRSIEPSVLTGDFSVVHWHHCPDITHSRHRQQSVMLFLLLRSSSQTGHSVFSMYPPRVGRFFKSGGRDRQCTIIHPKSCHALGYVWIRLQKAHHKLLILSRFTLGPLLRLAARIASEISLEKKWHKLKRYQI